MRRGEMMTFLIGMPGTGKSYWGQQVAAAYALPFIDLDSLIEEGEAMPIPQIFANYGEDGFRERERKCLLQILDAPQPGTIIACGGGTPCFYDNMALMKNAGTVIYLEADPDFLYENLLSSEVVRPLLTPNQPGLSRIKMLLGQRRHFYEQAHHILQVKDISLTTFAEIIHHV